MDDQFQKIDSDTESDDWEDSISDEQSIESFAGDGSYTCDACGEEIVIPLDPLGGTSQKYVEDCPVCCHPSVIHVDFLDTEARVWAEPEQDRY